MSKLYSIRIGQHSKEDLEDLKEQHPDRFKSLCALLEFMDSDLALMSSSSQDFADADLDIHEYVTLLSAR